MSAAGWQDLLAGRGLEGFHGQAGSFRREGDAILGEDGGQGDRLLFGDDTWSDYELEATVTLQRGQMAQLHYRVGAGGRCWYTLDLRLGQQRVTLGSADNRLGGPGLVVRAGLDHPLAVERPYDLRVVVSGRSAEGLLDGRSIGRVDDLAIDRGPAGLGLFGCAATFRSLRVYRPAR